MKWLQPESFHEAVRTLMEVAEQLHPEDYVHEMRDLASHVTVLADKKHAENERVGTPDRQSDEALLEEIFDASEIYGTGPAKPDIFGPNAATSTSTPESVMTQCVWTFVTPPQGGTTYFVPTP